MIAQTDNTKIGCKLGANLQVLVENTIDNKPTQWIPNLFIPFVNN